MYLPKEYNPRHSVGSFLLRTQQKKKPTTQAKQPVAQLYNSYRIGKDHQRVCVVATEHRRRLHVAAPPTTNNTCHYPNNNNNQERALLHAC